MTILWHYTCEHGRWGIGEQGFVYPMAAYAPEAAARMPEEWRWLSTLAWFTDRTDLTPVALGLQASIIKCDRSQFRYRVLDTSRCTRWLEVAKDYPRDTRVELGIGDHMPGAWWVATLPVPVELEKT